jgi:hypothetical protein
MLHNHINLEKFNHKLFIIILDDGKMASLMSFLSLGSGKMVVNMWWQHFLSPHGLSKRSLIWNTKTCYMKSTGSKYQSVIGIRDISPLRDRCFCPYESVIQSIRIKLLLVFKDKAKWIHWLLLCWLVQTEGKWSWNTPFNREQKLLGSIGHPFFTYQGSF